MADMSLYQYRRTEMSEMSRINRLHVQTSIVKEKITPELAEKRIIVNKMSYEVMT